MVTNMWVCYVLFQQLFYYKPTVVIFTTKGIVEILMTSNWRHIESTCLKKEDKIAIDEYAKEDPEMKQVGLCENYMLTMMKVNRADDKLNYMIFKHRCNDKLEELIGCINTLTGFMLWSHICDQYSIDPSSASNRMGYRTTSGPQLRTCRVRITFRVRVHSFLILAVGWNITGYNQKNWH